MKHIILFLALCGTVMGQSKPASPKAAVTKTCITPKTWSSVGKDENGFYHGNGWTDYHIYVKCVDGEWVDDTEAQASYQKELDVQIKKADDERQSRKNLWSSLETRRLTDQEMLDVLNYGYDLVPDNEGGYHNYCVGTCPYNVNDIEHRKSTAETAFQNALLNQFKMKVLSETPPAAPSEPVKPVCGTVVQPDEDCGQVNAPAPPVMNDYIAPPAKVPCPKGSDPNVMNCYAN